jgi:phosphotransferase system enzyme I (PtsI)
MDVGGDKELPHLHLQREPNPFLGLRGIRLSLEREEAFRVQLRALLKASPFGNLAIMLPMVSDIAEVRRTKELIAGIRGELAEAGDAVADVIPLGVMVETPAAALMAEEWAEEVDFFSIGTNDLTQYVLAVDRLNEKVSRLYQPFHPAVLRLIQSVAHAAGRRGKWVGLCGEMAAEPSAVPLLVGMGLSELSVSPASIPLVKNIVRGMSKAEGEALAREVLGLQSASQVLERLQDFLAERA